MPKRILQGTVVSEKNDKTVVVMGPGLEANYDPDAIQPDGC